MTIENDIRMNRIDKTKEAASSVNEELDWPNLAKYKSDNKILHKIIITFFMFFRQPWIVPQTSQYSN